MATDVASLSVNGNYAPHQGYGGLEQQNSYAYGNNSSSHQPMSNQPTPSQATSTTTPMNQQSDIPKDEVGWYFVEQYYKTLSRTPERLYLFYNKRSQFVSGEETDKVPVCVGPRAINERIKERDIQECKVRVTNVDSQASDSNIVIQVIGEMSNKQQPHKKFTQTFVLAQQTNGYFVLNDIFRYLIEEEDEPIPEVEAAIEPALEDIAKVPVVADTQGDSTQSVGEAESKTLTSSLDPVAIEHDAQQLDNELEDKVVQASPQVPEVPEAAVNGITTEDAIVEDQSPGISGAGPTQTSPPEPTPTVREVPEQPAEPEPTPVPSPPKQAAQAAPVPAKPLAPKTWASLAASANSKVIPPATSNAAPSTSSQPQARPAASTAPKVASQAAATPVAPVTPPQASAPSQMTPAAGAQDASLADAGQSDEWTSVGGNHNRNQSRQVNIPPPAVSAPNRGYIGKVFPSVDGPALRAHLETFGEVTWFDIAESKSCAFVDFKTVDGYNAAVQANPHVISGENLILEARKFRPGATPYVQRGGFQNRGRGGPGQGPPRGNYAGGLRGNYAPRGARGGSGTATPRGRGGSSQLA